MTREPDEIRRNLIEKPRVGRVFYSCVFMFRWLLVFSLVALLPFLVRVGPFLLTDVVLEADGFLADALPPGLTATWRQSGWDTERKQPLGEFFVERHHSAEAAATAPAWVDPSNNKSSWTTAEMEKLAAELVLAAVELPHARPAMRCCNLTIVKNDFELQRFTRRKCLVVQLYVVKCANTFHETSEEHS